MNSCASIESFGSPGYNLWMAFGPRTNYNPAALFWPKLTPKHHLCCWKNGNEIKPFDNLSISNIWEWEMLQKTIKTLGIPDPQ